MVALGAFLKSALSGGFLSGQAEGQPLPSQSQWTLLVLACWGCMKRAQGKARAVRNLRVQPL
jgi:hypothetical protein